MKSFIFGVLNCVMLVVAAKAQAAGDIALRSEKVLPSEANPAVTHFDDPNLIMTAPKLAADAPLAVFLPGSNGKPEKTELILRTIAQQGYRVIGLTYNDSPSGVQICRQNSPPNCLAQFRETRITGRGSGTDSISPAESIEQRLVSLLTYLGKREPHQGWENYLTPQGDLRWDRIALSGLSQGAGMAAFMAKRHLVYRVVLFSSPWDNTGHDHRPSPWLSLASATPPDRWWAERHVRENTTDLIAHAYQQLQIPHDHILLFDAPLAEDAGTGENPYHPSTIHNPVYQPQWRILFGSVHGAE